MSSKNYDTEYIALQIAFAKAKEDKNIILSNYDLIPLRSTSTLASSAIVQAAKSQNVWCSDSIVAILRGVSDLDASLTLCTVRGNSTLRTFLQNQYIASMTAGTPDFLFKQVESATYQRVYLLHKKIHTKAVKIFLRTFDSKSKNLFTVKSLSLARCAPGISYGTQMAPQSDLTKTADSQLKDFF